MTDPKDIDCFVGDGHDPHDGHEETHEASGGAGGCMVPFPSEDHDEDGDGCTC